MAREKSKNQAEHSRKWYLAHRQEQIDRAARFRKKYQAIAVEFLADYKRTHPCVDCGEDDPIVLDFDHVKGKKKMSLCQMKSAGMSLRLIEEEIAKCEVRCSNCHRRVTHARRKKI